jgi:hypothetical protein
MELPTQPVRVVFTPPGSPKTVIAAMVPSQDQVGRKYPLVIFALVPSTATASSYSLLPLAASNFLEAAVSLGARAPSLDLEQLRAAVSALPAPGPTDLTHAQQLGEKALGYPLLSEVHQRIFGGVDGMHLYAYQTFLTACQDAARTDPGKPATMLDCPIRVDVDLFVWLEIARRVFGFPASPPAFFWTEDPSPRLLISLGVPPLHALQFAANPALEHQRLWPVTTQRPQAIEAARGALGPSFAALNEHAPLAGLFEVLAQRSAAGSIR